MTENTTRGTIQLIYIGGFGHSGSTILEILLSCNSNTKGLGELFRFGEALNSRYTKKLLKSSSHCSEMYARIKSELLEIGETLHSFEEVSDCEKFFAYSARNFEKYNLLWKTYFLAVQNKDDSITIVDSSKSSFRIAKRYLLLKEMDELETVMVHLVRHPKPILFRLLKKQREKRVTISSLFRLYFLTKCSINWLFATIWPLLSSNKERYIRISFEQLCENPEETLTEIENAVGIDLSEAKYRIRNGESLPSTCAITGNMRVRKNEKLTFNPSKKELPKTDIITSMFSLCLSPVYHLLK